MLTDSEPDARVLGQALVILESCLAERAFVESWGVAAREAWLASLFRAASPVEVEGLLTQLEGALKCLPEPEGLTA